ncbi:MAG TPA: FAD-dependent oxidoreductase, partial [Candidatus Saccharimonadales bacterium]
MSKIVIIGAGFTGALAARRLARKKYTVTLIDRKSHFLFLPRLADILAGASSERWTRAPLDKLAQRFGYAFVQGNVVSIDRDRRQVTLADGQV